MDCSGRSNTCNVERDSELGDDLSHEEHSDEEMRDCDSIEAEHISALAARTANGRLNNTIANNGCSLSGGEITYTGNHGVGLGTNRHSPDTPTDIQMNHHHQFSTNHPLNALGNFMGISGLHGLPNMQHNDVLEKLKMQVREMKVGLMEQDYAAAHAAAFGANVLPTPINTAFSLPPTSMAPFGHASQNIVSSQANSSLSNGAVNMSGNMSNPNSTLSTPISLANGSNGSANGAGNMPFSFTSPTAPNNSKDANLASNSSTSSEASNSSQQNNGWSFEEQYKQVRQLYEINDDPKRKEFLDDLFSFMQKRGTPINRLPIMAKSVLDLYELYNLVIARGGLVDVINKKLWQEIIKGLHLPSSITSAAFTLRTQYMKFLYPYECEKKNLSSPAELQAAIDGNRREGRRSSYGQYETMHSPMQMQMSRQALPGGMQQMSPLALVTHAAANNQQAQAAAAAAAAAHHRLMAPNFGQVPNLMTNELEQRMMEYLKLIQVKKEQQNAAVAAAAAASNAVTGNNGLGLSPHNMQQHQQQQQQQQQQRHRSQSPEITPRDALNALEMSRVALWQMYHNNTSPPASVNASPQGAAANLLHKHAEPQRSEALNLSDSPPNVANIKRERDREGSAEPCERDEFSHQPPPPKRAPIMPAFPGGFWPPSMAAAAAAANFRQSVNAQHDSDMENDGEHDEGDDEGEHNTTANSTNSIEANNDRQLNGHHMDLHHHHTHHNHPLLHGHNHALHHHHSNIHHSDNKSDDSAIEHSPSTSAGDGSAAGGVAGNNGVGLSTNAEDDAGNISPVSTKKVHMTKQSKSVDRHKSGPALDDARLNKAAFDAINLFSGLQFNVEHNGVNSNGNPQLMVNLQLNGIKYSGILLGKTQADTTIRKAKSTMNATTTVAAGHRNSNNNNNDHNSNSTSQAANKDVEEMETEEESTIREVQAAAALQSDNNVANMRNCMLETMSTRKNEAESDSVTNNVDGREGVEQQQQLQHERNNDNHRHSDEDDEDVAGEEDEDDEDEDDDDENDENDIANSTTNATITALTAALPATTTTTITTPRVGAEVSQEVLSNAGVISTGCVVSTQLKEALLTS